MAQVLYGTGIGVWKAPGGTPPYIPAAGGVGTKPGMGMGTLMSLLDGTGIG